MVAGGRTRCAGVGWAAVVSHPTRRPHRLSRSSIAEGMLKLGLWYRDSVEIALKPPVDCNVNDDGLLRRVVRGSVDVRVTASWRTHRCLVGRIRSDDRSKLLPPTMTQECRAHPLLLAAVLHLA